MEFYLTYMMLTGLGRGDRGSQVHSRHGNYLTYNNHSNLTGVLYSLKSFNVCSQSLITRQMDSLRLGRQRRNEDND